MALTGTTITAAPQTDPALNNIGAVSNFSAGSDISPVEGFSGNDQSMTYERSYNLTKEAFEPLNSTIIR